MSEGACFCKNERCKEHRASTACLSVDRTLGFFLIQKDRAPNTQVRRARTKNVLPKMFALSHTMNASRTAFRWYVCSFHSGYVGCFSLVFSRDSKAGWTAGCTTGRTAGCAAGCTVEKLASQKIGFVSSRLRAVSVRVRFQNSAEHPLVAERTCGYLLSRTGENARARNVWIHTQVRRIQPH